MCFGSVVSAVILDKETDLEPYAFIPYSESEASLATSGNTPEMETLGPKSFAIAEDGTIYILDTLNEKVKHYTVAGKFINDIELPAGFYGIDLEVTDSILCVLGDNGELISVDIEPNYNSVASSTVNSSHDILKTYEEIPISDIIGLYREDNIIFIKSWSGYDIKINKVSSEIKSLSKDKSAIQKSTDSNGNIILEKDDIVYEINYSAQPIGTYIIKSDSDSTYIMEQEALLGSFPYAETRVGRYVDGKKVATALPISTVDYDYCLPFKKLCVTDEGIVYQMVPEKEGIAIYCIPWINGAASRITTKMIELNAQPFDEQSTNRKDTFNDLATVNRTTAISRANNMCVTGWWYNGTTHRTPNTSTTRSPVHLSTTAKQVAGLPYCWGGMNGLDTGTYTGSSAQNMKNFSKALSDGQTAGNVLCSGNYKSGTAGVDCSGFISAAYKFNFKLSTSSIPSYFTTTTWANVLEGDIANRAGSHVFMIKYKYTSGGEFYMMSTYESTTDGSYQGTTYMHRYLSDVVNKYTPMKK